jgi:hypothetical protein
MLKNIILALSLAIISVGVVHAEPEIKKVCIDQKDEKSGKTKQVCKQVAQHKKLEGTVVPVKK